MKKNKSTWSQFANILKKIKPNKKLLITGLIIYAVSTVTGLFFPIFTQKIIDSFSSGKIQIKFLVFLGLVFLISGVASTIGMYLLGYCGNQMVLNLRQMLWNKYLELPVSFFDEHKSGENTSRLVTDTTIVKDLGTFYFPDFVSNVISIIGTLAILFIMDWKMTLVMIAAIPLSALVLIPLGSKMSQVSKLTQDETADFTGYSNQILDNMRLVKASNAERQEKKNGYENMTRLFRLGLKETKIMAVVIPTMFFIMTAIIALVIGYGGIRMKIGDITSGTFIAFLLYLIQIIFPVTSIANFFNQVNKAKGAMERIHELLLIPAEEFNNGQPVNVSNQILTLKNVNFSYKEDNDIIKNISISVNPGQVVAFVGPSGGGKTTLFSLLERFYIPQEGEILIGDTPIEHVELSAWRKQIGYVTQESLLLSGTIRENLTFGLEREVSEEELWTAAKQAYADRFIKEMPNQFDTEVGEHGLKLSGGQRQRIAIARAFLRNPIILMLDEATASLDSQSEQMVQEALQNLMNGWTTLVIAHRLSTVVHADQIFFIENGEITGKGKHEFLVKNHPLYKTFAEQQLQLES